MTQKQQGSKDNQTYFIKQKLAVNRYININASISFLFDDFIIFISFYNFLNKRNNIYKRNIIHSFVRCFYNKHINI